MNCSQKFKFLGNDIDTIITYVPFMIPDMIEWVFIMLDLFILVKLKLTNQKYTYTSQHEENPC